jgi:hypothetical protein
VLTAVSSTEAIPRRVDLLDHSDVVGVCNSGSKPLRDRCAGRRPQPQSLA